MAAIAGLAAAAGLAGLAFSFGLVGLAAGLSDLSFGQMSLHFPYLPLPFTKTPFLSTSVGHHGTSLFPVSPTVMHES